MTPAEVVLGEDASLVVAARLYWSTEHRLSNRKGRPGICVWRPSSARRALLLTATYDRGRGHEATTAVGVGVGVGVPSRALNKHSMAARDTRIARWSRAWGARARSQEPAQTGRPSSLVPAQSRRPSSETYTVPLHTSSHLLQCCRVDKEAPRRGPRASGAPPASPCPRPPPAALDAINRSAARPRTRISIDVTCRCRCERAWAGGATPTSTALTLGSRCLAAEHKGSQHRVLSLTQASQISLSCAVEG
ncbi:hypothetical protein K505DRAFT_123345 [Melanomma pulvis-pyrius CBS 109.77]|uniref:Uncharacterized protein n=1 Tax=Melanomma pulvis-pyrius CBS 109.77 TaxID=1314802 RepID=A0A6A6WUA2_9PLEO|nr:hypothetical protein K505DRAFT_123345 [Melanomma pulvis-pyrius CBS 109.77]